MTTEIRTPIGRKMFGVCGTPGCGERARWLPIPEANQLGSATLWRCEACTEAVPWTHAYADPSDGPWRVSCPDCHGGGVSGEFTREEANQRVIDHRAWHLADALEARRRYAVHSGSDGIVATYASLAAACDHRDALPDGPGAWVTEVTR